MRFFWLMCSLLACISCKQKSSVCSDEYELPSSYDMTVHYMSQTDSLTLEDSIAMQKLSVSLTQIDDNCIQQEDMTWKSLKHEVEYFYYLLTASPKWYAGSEGIIEYHAGVRDITSLHLAMYNADQKGDPETVNRYFAPAISLEIFTNCCQSALDTTIPTEPDSAYTYEQNEELHQCYQSASASLSRIKVRASQWVEARNKIADSVDSVAIIDPDYWTRPEYINCNTSILLVELAKIVSPM